MGDVVNSLTILDAGADEQVARAMEVLHHALKQQSVANKWEEQLKLEREAYADLQRALQEEQYLETSAGRYEAQMKSAQLQTSIADTEKQVAAEVNELLDKLLDKDYLPRPRVEHIDKLRKKSRH